MKFASSRSHERGDALIEFALSFFLIFAVFGGIFQFAYSFYVYNAVMTSVENAAELGSKMTYDTANTSKFTTAVTNMVLYGNTTAGTNPIVPGLSSSNVTVSLNLKNSIPTDVTVSISNYSVDCLFTKFNFNGKPRATAVYMGQVTCSTC